MHVDETGGGGPYTPAEIEANIAKAQQNKNDETPKTLEEMWAETLASSEESLKQAKGPIATDPMRFVP